MKEVRRLLEEKYGGKRTRAAEKDIARLERGEHIDYVIGWVDFLGCKIDLSEKPLIPRPETEYWTGKAIHEIGSRAIKFSSRFTLKGSDASRKILSLLQPYRVLDMFAGSGCIGIAILKHIPWATVDFAEKEEKFLKQIRINANLNGIEAKRYRVIQSDVFSKIKGRYDVIVANPPYVAEVRKARVQKSVLENEPSGAVFGGRDGLRYIHKFLKGVRRYLAQGGAMYIEFDSPQKTEVVKLMKAAGAKEVKIYKDQFGRWRYAHAVFGLSTIELFDR